MSKEPLGSLGESGLSFFGSVTASISHEINNVIAIINEYNGLFSDLLEAEKAGGRPVQRENLERIADNIKGQVKRGEQIAKRLNRFAHSVDAPVATFSLNQMMDDTVEIARRFADLSRVRLELRLPEEPKSLVSRPFRLQQAVFLCIRIALDSAAADEAVRVAWHLAESGVEICIEGPRALRKERIASDLSSLDRLLETLEGRLEVVSTDQAIQSFRLHLPLAVSQGSDFQEAPLP